MTAGRLHPLNGDLHVHREDVCRFTCVSQALAVQQERRERRQASSADCQSGDWEAADATCDVVNGNNGSNSSGIRNNGNGADGSDNSSGGVRHDSNGVASSGSVHSSRGSNTSQSSSNSDEDQRCSPTLHGKRCHGKSPKTGSSGESSRDGKLADESPSEAAAAQEAAAQDEAEEVDPRLQECHIQQSIARQVVRTQAEALVVAVTKLQVLCRTLG